MSVDDETDNPKEAPGAAASSSTGKAFYQPPNKRGGATEDSRGDSKSGK